LREARTKPQESYLAGVVYSTCRVDLSRSPEPGRYTGDGIDGGAVPEETKEGTKEPTRSRASSKTPDLGRMQQTSLAISAARTHGGGGANRNDSSIQ